MSRPSSRNLMLPPPEQLERICQSIATLDAIISPEWEFRYYSFNRLWNPERRERMASMRNGAGDEYFILFHPLGVILKGFAHESAMASHGSPLPGMFDGVPSEFAGFLQEPAFNIKDTSFCLWNRGDGWKRGSAMLAADADPDGSEELLRILSGNPLDYQEFARDYFEVEVSLEAVERFYRHEPVSNQLIQELNSDVALSDLRRDLDEIGYPIN